MARRFREHLVAALASVYLTLPLVAGAADIPDFGRGISIQSSHQTVQPEGIALQGSVVVRIQIGNAINVNADKAVTDARSEATLFAGRIKVAFNGGVLIAEQATARQVSVSGRTYIEVTAERATLTKAEYLGSPTAPLITISALTTTN